MKKVFVVGSITTDLLFKADILEKKEEKGRWSLAHGGKYLVDKFKILHGGGGANAAVSLAKQGLDVWLMGRLGNDIFGKMARANLKKHHIKNTALKFMKNPSAVSAVIVDKSGDKTIFNYRSAADDFHISPKELKLLKKVNWLALFSCPKWEKEEKTAFLKKAHLLKKHVFLSLHGSEYKKGINYLKPYFKYTSILHLNAYELADLLGKNISEVNFYKENVSQILNIPLVLISHDSKGAYAHTVREIYYQTAIKPSRILDSTGAGDAFASGFLGHFAKTGDIRKALYFGAKNGSSVIKHYGAQVGLLK